MILIWIPSLISFNLFSPPSVFCKSKGNGVIGHKAFLILKVAHKFFRQFLLHYRTKITRGKKKKRREKKNCKWKGEKIKTKSANSHQSIHQISTRKFSLSPIFSPLIFIRLILLFFNFASCFFIFLCVSVKAIAHFWLFFSETWVWQIFAKICQTLARRFFGVWTADPLMFGFAKIARIIIAVVVDVC